MVIPLRNIAYDRIRSAGSLTDADLLKGMAKEGHALSDGRLNKLLLDMEILGLVKVSWITRDERRIEVNADEREADAVEAQNKKMTERDYEASFPGFEK